MCGGGGIVAAHWFTRSEGWREGVRGRGWGWGRGAELYGVVVFRGTWVTSRAVTILGLGRSPRDYVTWFKHDRTKRGLSAGRGGDQGQPSLTSDSHFKDTQ